MKSCVVFTVFCAITALSQVKAKAMADAERDNIDLKEELKELVESIEMRNLAQEKQDESIDMSKTAQVEEAKRGRCASSEYPCVGGRCIPVRWICDGDRDCPGGEDERICRDPDCDRYCPYGGCKSWEGKCYGYCYCYGSGYAQFCDNCQA